MAASAAFGEITRVVLTRGGGGPREGSGDELISEEFDEEVAVQEWPGVEGGGRDKTLDMDEVAA